LALERKWDAVPPQYFTADGTIFGVVTVADTAGFYVKQVASLENNNPSISPLAVQIKRVLGPTLLVVGLVDNKIAIFKPLDVSAFTMASAATISAAEQDKNAVPPDPHYLAVYEGDPICADRVIGVDQYGRKFNYANPYPTNIIPASLIPFTLGSLALPGLISQYLGTLTFNEVTSDTVGTEEVLTFFDGATNVGQINLAQTEDGWVLNLGVPEEDFLLLETGSFFVLEDDSGGILLET